MDVSTAHLAGEVVMEAAYFGVANLSADQVNKLQALEKELGAAIVALKPIVPLVELNPEQIKRLEAVEQEMGVVLLACKSS
jgi:hypothetical protein